MPSLANQLGHRTAWILGKKGYVLEGGKKHLQLVARDERGQVRMGVDGVRMCITIARSPTVSSRGGRGGNYTEQYLRNQIGHEEFRRLCDEYDER